MPGPSATSNFNKQHLEFFLITWSSQNSEFSTAHHLQPNHSPFTIAALFIRLRRHKFHHVSNWIIYKKYINTTNTSGIYWLRFNFKGLFWGLHQGSPFFVSKESLAADLRRQSTLKGFSGPSQAKGTRTKMDEAKFWSNERDNAGIWWIFGYGGWDGCMMVGWSSSKFSWLIQVARLRSLPAAAPKRRASRTLRDWWGFDGCNPSDCQLGQDDVGGHILGSEIQTMESVIHEDRKEEIFKMIIYHEKDKFLWFQNASILETWIQAKNANSTDIFCAFWIRLWR